LLGRRDPRTTPDGHAPHHKGERWQTLECGRAIRLPLHPRQSPIRLPLHQCGRKRGVLPAACGDGDILPQPNRAESVDNMSVNTNGRSPRDHIAHLIAVRFLSVHPTDPRIQKIVVSIRETIRDKAFYEAFITEARQPPVGKIKEHTMSIETIAAGTPMPRYKC